MGVKRNGNKVLEIPHYLSLSLSLSHTHTQRDHEVFIEDEVDRNLFRKKDYEIENSKETLNFWCMLQ
jgi:hypothetical protein